MSTFEDFESPPPAAPAAPPPSFSDPIPTDAFPPGPPLPPAVHGWAPVARRPRSWTRPALVGALMVVCAAGGAGAATLAGAGLSSGASPRNSAASSGGVQNPLLPGTSTGSSGSTAGSGASPAQNVARVKQATVIITSTLPANEGVAEGTGMVITSNGEVLTNNHVIAGSTGITVQIGATGPTYKATVIGDDPSADVALVQIQGVSGLTTVPIGDSSTVTAGETVTAIGNALGRGTLVSVKGTVTALNQTITASEDGSGYGAETLTGLLETNAPIQPGDSGGPVIDATGRVIAMDTAAETAGRPFGSSQSPAAAAYAIGINSAMTIAHEIAAGGDGNPNIEIGGGALLGVEVATQGGTAQVIGVTAGGPAAAAGIAAGDVITGLGGAAITSPASLHQVMLQHRPGQQVTLTWIDTAGASHSATVTLASGPPA